ncbi:helix-turn-helix domain-containing protein [Streptococcus alactolyticus]
MIISKEIAEKVRIKRGKLAMTKQELCLKLGIARQTLVKIEKGEYKCPVRIYESVVNWLLEDL